MIDLGEVTPAAETPPMPVNLPRLWRVVLAVLTVAGLLATTASAPAGPGGVHQLWSTRLRAGDSWSVSGDTAYVTRNDDKVSAYRLATGELKWSVPAGALLGDRRPYPFGDVVLVPADPVIINQKDPAGNRYTFESVRTTVALDAATGEERWRAGGEVYPDRASGTALALDEDAQARTIGLRVTRLADGAEVWDHPTPPAVSWVPLQDDDGRTTGIATITQGGLVDIYDYATGEVRRSSRLPWTDTKQQSTTLLAAGTYLAVMRDQTTETATTVYRVDDLQPLWSTTESDGYVTTCGQLLCSVGSNGVTGRDPHSGTARWQLTDMGNMWPAGRGRILVNEGQPDSEFYLVDPATGGRIGAPITGLMAYPSDPGDLPMYLKPITDPPNRLAVVAIDPADGAQRTLGTIPMVTTDDVCMTTPGYLACVRDFALDITAVD